MSFLTKISLDYETAYKMKLYDSYQWHKFSWELFPNKPDKEREFLTRLDQQDNILRFMIVSNEQPMKPSWAQNDMFLCKEINESFFKHNNYRFDLKANPTRKVKSFDESGAEKKNGKRLAIIQEEEQLEWLKQKAESNGFQVMDNPPVTIMTQYREFFSIKRRDTNGLHIGVRFTGFIRILDKEKFVRAFKKGIGSAKGFGFGLLMLEPYEL